MKDVYEGSSSPVVTVNYVSVFGRVMGNAPDMQRSSSALMASQSPSIEPLQRAHHSRVTSSVQRRNKRLRG